MKLATALLATTAVIALAGCNRTAGNNSAAANMTAGNATAPAPAPAGNSAMPAGNDMGGGNGAKPAATSRPATR